MISLPCAATGELGVVYIVHLVHVGYAGSCIRMGKSIHFGFSVFHFSNLNVSFQHFHITLHFFLFFLTKTSHNLHQHISENLSEYTHFVYNTLFPNASYFCTLFSLLMHTLPQYMWVFFVLHISLGWRTTLQNPEKCEF